MSEAKKEFFVTQFDNVRLLRSALGFNPWQLGEDMWSEVAEEMRNEFRGDYTPRAVKNRVDLLIDKFNKKMFKYSSGTEEENTERSVLLESVIALKVEESAAILKEVTPEDSEMEGDASATGPGPASPKKSTKERRMERLQADKERAAYVDEAPGPSTSKGGKRQRLSVEEEVMFERHRHEMQVEKEKIELEKERVKSEERLQDKRLYLEEKREQRLSEESKRRDDIAKSQIDLQVSMMQVMRKFVDK